MRYKNNHLVLIPEKHVFYPPKQPNFAVFFPLALGVKS